MQLNNLPPGQNHNNEQGNEPMDRRALLWKGGSILAASTGIWLGIKALMKRGEKEHNDHMKHREVEVQMYSEADALEHIRQSQTRILSLQNAVEHERCGCIDGRNNRCDCCVPGGDLGNSYRQLSAYQEALGRPLTKQEVLNYLRANLQREQGGRRKTFYLHTEMLGDDNSGHDTIGHVGEHLHTDAAGFLRMLENPNEHGEEIKRLMKLPDSHGCGHVKNILKNAHSYRTRNAQVPTEAYKQLMEYLIEAVLELKWNHADLRDRITIDPLPGAHRERAALVIKGKRPARPAHRVPLMQPYLGESNGLVRSAFLYYPDVEKISDQQMMDRAEALGLPAVDRDRCLALMEELGGTSLEATRLALAPTKPVFIAEYDEDGNLDAPRRAA